MPTVKYVRIPADISEPLEELELEVPPDLETNLSCFTTTLQDYFRRTGGAFTAEGKAAMKESVVARLQQQQPGSAGPDMEMLDRLAESQTVDIVQVLPATKNSEYMGVNLYVDDKGVSRGSPRNARASAICQQCGSNTDILGDGFLARVWDDQEGFERHDFTIADVSSDAPWVQLAARLAAQRLDPQAAAARLQEINTPKAGPAQPELGVDERIAAGAAERAAGTTAFKGGDLSQAASKYEAALALFHPLPDGFPSDGAAATSAAELRLACELNLAMCRLKLNEPYLALNACDRAVELDGKSAKAWYRRGLACMVLEQYEAARRHLTRACQLEPGNREIREKIDECKTLSAAKHGA